jgi:hypothetical protein
MASVSPVTETQREPGRNRPRARLAMRVAMRLGIIGLGTAAVIALSGGQASAAEREGLVGSLVDSVDRVVETVGTPGRPPMPPAARRRRRPR